MNTGDRSVSARIGAHIRGNVVGYIAIFIALGGTAVALPGRNSVDSGDIQRKQVKRSDLALNAVDGTRLADGAVAGADLSSGAVVGGTGGDVADGSITNADVTTNPAGDLTGQNIDEASLSGVNAATFGGNSPQRFLAKTSQFDYRSANVVVDTATAADGADLLGGDSSRFRLEATGVAHNFQLCDQLGDAQHYFKLTEADGWVGTAGTIPASPNCTADLSTGGVSNTAAGAMILFAPNGVIFIGPATESSLPGGQDPRRYNIASFGFATDACGAPGASC